MITSRIHFNAVYEVERRGYTTQQLVRGFAAYGIYVMNEVRKDFPRITPSELAFKAYADALHEYTLALSCVIEDNLEVPNDFTNANRTTRAIKHLIDEYYYSPKRRRGL